MRQACPTPQTLFGHHSPPVWASNLLVAMASISSMKMMAGAFSLARRNTSRTMRGPSPRYFCTNSEPTTRINAADGRTTGVRQGWVSGRAHSALTKTGNSLRRPPSFGCPRRVILQHLKDQPSACIPQPPSGTNHEPCLQMFSGPTVNNQHISKNKKQMYLCFNIQREVLEAFMGPEIKKIWLSEVLEKSARKQTGCYA